MNPRIKKSSERRLDAVTFQAVISTTRVHWVDINGEQLSVQAEYRGRWRYTWMLGSRTVSRKEALSVVYQDELRISA